MMRRADDPTLAARLILIHYRYCDRCRREWPPETLHSPNCCLWLGEIPRERPDWQFVPAVGLPMATLNQIRRSDDGQPDTSSGIGIRRRRSWLTPPNNPSRRRE
jgi:hypothetical protein